MRRVSKRRVHDVKVDSKGTQKAFSSTTHGKEYDREVHTQLTCFSTADMRDIRKAAMHSMTRIQIRNPSVEICPQLPHDPVTAGPHPPLTPPPALRSQFWTPCTRPGPPSRFVTLRHGFRPKVCPQSILSRVSSRSVTLPPWPPQPLPGPFEAPSPSRPPPPGPIPPLSALHYICFSPHAGTAARPISPEVQTAGHSQFSSCCDRQV